MLRASYVFSLSCMIHLREFNASTFSVTKIQRYTGIVYFIMKRVSSVTILINLSHSTEFIDINIYAVFTYVLWHVDPDLNLPSIYKNLLSDGRDKIIILY